MLKENYRLKLIISFAIGAIFILLTLTVYWNVSAIVKENLGYLPLLFTVIAIAAVSNLFRIAFKLSDYEKINELIATKVSEGKATLLKELKEKDEKKNINETIIDNTEEIAKQLVPSGNFKNPDSFGKKLLINIANELNLVQGILYLAKEKTKDFTFCSGYALTDDNTPGDFKIGENLNGEVAKNKVIMMVNEIPVEYFNIESGLGQAKPGFLCIVPVLFENKTTAIIELASFTELSESNIKLLERIAELSSTKIKQIVKA